MPLRALDLTFTWDNACSFGMLQRGTPVPPTQSKDQVSYFGVKEVSNLTTVTIPVETGNYYFRIYCGQSTTAPNYPIYSNIIKVLVYPDGSFWSDTPGSPGKVTNFRFI